MFKSVRKLALAACAGAAMVSSVPASAQTVVMYFNTSHFMVGYIIYGNDGQICEQWGRVTTITSTLQVAGDC